MRLDVDYGFTGDGDEDWGIAYLYLNDDEIAKYGLMPTDYKGGNYDWISLPDRDYGAEKGEHLIAAYGGMLSEICMVKSVADGTTAAGAYYGRKDNGWEDDSKRGLIDLLPDELTGPLFEAIENYCGTYNKTDFENPFFDRKEKKWVEAE